MSDHTARPEKVIDRFAELISAGDASAAADLYEPEASFAPEPGRVVRGLAAIRAELEAFAALRPEFSGTIEHVLEVGNIALVVNRWELRGRGPDGADVEMSGRSADVMRRRGDGTWGILIDDPWSGGERV
jgi:uncharacterized protein (TIGR02246 family)